MVEASLFLCVLCGGLVWSRALVSCFSGGRGWSPVGMWALYWRGVRIVVVL